MCGVPTAQLIYSISGRSWKSSSILQAQNNDNDGSHNYSLPIVGLPGSRPPFVIMWFEFQTKKVILAFKKFRVKLVKLWVKVGVHPVASNLELAAKNSLRWRFWRGERSRLFSMATT